MTQLANLEYGTQYFKAVSNSRHDGRRDESSITLRDELWPRSRHKDKGNYKEGTVAINTPISLSFLWSLWYSSRIPHWPNTTETHQYDQGKKQSGEGGPVYLGVGAKERYPTQVCRNETYFLQLNLILTRCSHSIFYRHLIYLLSYKLRIHLISIT